MFHKNRKSKNIQELQKNCRPNELSGEAIIVKQSRDLIEGGRDAAYAVQINRQLLKLLGIWQSGGFDKFNRRQIIAKISSTLCYFGLGMSVVPTALYIVVEMRDPIGKVKLIGPWSFCVMVTLKYLFLQSHRRDIEKCMKNIELDWLRIESEAYRDIMLDYARYGHLVTMICATLTYSGGIFFAILPFVMGGLTSDNLNNNATARALSLPSHFIFFDATETPAYEIIYSIQIVATFAMHSITIASYSLAVVIVMHACGQLKIVMRKLNELVDGDDESATYESIDNRMSDLIRHHVRVLRFISAAEKMLREICLGDLGGCTLNLCLLGYFILLEWSSKSTDAITLLTFLILFFSFVFNIFSFCYIGELVTGECKKIGETSYMIDWHRLPRKQSLGLCLIIAMAHEPVTLTAGGAIQLSFACFTKVINTSMGYLNMLRAVTV